MQISNTTIEDGKHCAAVINALNIAKFDGLTGKDMDTLVAAKRWLHGIATQMAAQLKVASAPKQEISAPAAPMKIKAMGPMAKGKKK
jgi:hypothetical protein